MNKGESITYYVCSMYYITYVQCKKCASDCFDKRGKVGAATKAISCSSARGSLAAVSSRGKDYWALLDL